MKILLAAFIVIAFSSPICKGLQEHQRLLIKKSKLTRFFQENNSSISSSEERKDKEIKKNETKIIIHSGHKDRGNYNESLSGNSRHIIKNSTNHSKFHNARKEKVEIGQLLCKLFNISKEVKACKGKHYSKKAMIWPTKMLPWLKKVLINKLYHRQNPLSLLENPSEIPFGAGLADRFNDNWDESLFKGLRKHHGLRMVPLVKSLKTKLFGGGQPNSVDSLNEALNGEGLNSVGQGNSHFFRQILRQALGGSDRDTVLKEMKQELMLANDRGENGGNERIEDLSGRNGVTQFNNGIQDPPIMEEPSQGIVPGQLGSLNMLQGGMKPPFMEQPIHAQMLDNGVIAPMPEQLTRGSPFKMDSSFSGSPFARSSTVDSYFKMSPLASLQVNDPTSRNSQLASSFPRAPTREGSLLQRAGGFDLPMSNSQVPSNPTQRMQTEFEDGDVRSMDEFNAHDDRFLEQNEPTERISHQLKPISNNLVMEEISDNTARGRNFPVQRNPDIDRLMRLHSRYRSPETTMNYRSSRFGLRLPMDSNSIGIASVLGKDEDSINFTDLDNQRPLAFRRGKVLKGSSNSHTKHRDKSTWKYHKVVSRV
ncbi:uncharacterized protein LOC141881996 [Acropora palmata]|uniref:uncharacterized protein LOC141881996 n=1 Tax=Acropora palmata TaxID=6131 RepID=UPI003DA0E1A8